MRLGECEKVTGEVEPDVLCVEETAEQRAKKGSIRRAKHQNHNQESFVQKSRKKRKTDNFVNS